MWPSSGGGGGGLHGDRVYVSVCVCVWKYRVVLKMGGGVRTGLHFGWVFGRYLPTACPRGTPPSRSLSAPAVAPAPYSHPRAFPSPPPPFVVSHPRRTLSPFSLSPPSHRTSPHQPFLVPSPSRAAPFSAFVFRLRNGLVGAYLVTPRLVSRLSAARSGSLLIPLPLPSRSPRLVPCFPPFFSLGAPRAWPR